MGAPTEFALKEAILFCSSRRKLALTTFMITDLIHSALLPSSKPTVRILENCWF